MWRRGGERKVINRARSAGTERTSISPVDIKRALPETVSHQPAGHEPQRPLTRPLTAVSCVDDVSVYDESYWTDEEQEEVEDSVSNSRTPYRKSCDTLGVLQSISIKRCHSLHKIFLRYNLLRENHVKALAVSLMWNKQVKMLDLRGCNITLQSCQYVCEMLNHNGVISTLDLSENSLKTSGLVLLCDTLLTNNAISKLALDQNEFRDADACHICAVLETKSTLKELSLRGNYFSLIAGDHFNRALSINPSLSSLDVGWNQFRMTGASLFIQGLEANESIIELDLSWNGLGIRGCVAMAICLKSNNTLQSLDISANRITREAFSYLLEALTVNKTLKTLKIGDNPITTEGVMDFMKILLKSDPKKVMPTCEEVDFADICVGSEFSKLYAEVLRAGRDITIKHGSALKQDDLIPRIEKTKVIHSEQPVFVLFDCMRENNLRIVDLFHAFDKDKSNSLTRQEIKEGLLTMNIPLSSRALDLLVKQTDTDHDGKVSITDLMAVQKDYHKYLTKRRNEERAKFGSTSARSTSARRKARSMMKPTEQREPR